MNKHYIYIYLDPRKPGNFCYQENYFDFEPFYVGVGSGSRDTAHLRKSNLKNDPNKHKTNKIKKILSCEMRPIVVHIKENLLFQDALELEKQLISQIGRNDLVLGPLTNLTNGGEGYTGPKTEAHKQKLSKARLGKTVVLSKESLQKRSLSRKQNHRGYDQTMREAISKTRKERGVAKGNKNPAFRNDINNNQIKQLREEGYSLRKIAVLFDTSHRTISERLKCI